MSNDSGFVQIDLTSPGDIGGNSPGGGSFTSLNVTPEETDAYGVQIVVTDPSIDGSPQGALKISVQNAADPNPALNINNTGLGPDIQLAAGVTISEVSGELVFEDTSAGSVSLSALLSAGSGDVSGPVSSTLNALVRWGGTDGTSVLNSQLVLTESGADVTLTGAGGISLVTTGADLVATSGAEILLQDSRTASIPFSDGSNSTLFGGATSLLGAINAAGASGSGATLTVGRVSVNAGGITANTTLTSSNTTQVTDAPNALIAYDDADQFTDSLLIWLDGVLQAPGVDSNSDNDVYAAGTAANGEMAFEFDLVEGQIITIVKLA